MSHEHYAPLSNSTITCQEEYVKRMLCNSPIETMFPVKRMLCNSPIKTMFPYAQVPGVMSTLVYLLKCVKKNVGTIWYGLHPVKTKFLFQIQSRSCTI